MKEIRNNNDIRNRKQQNGRNESLSILSLSYLPSIYFKCKCIKVPIKSLETGKIVFKKTKTNPAICCLQEIYFSSDRNKLEVK